MTNPKFGQPSLGAVVGAVVGAVGGLIAMTLPLAILKHDIHALSSARTVGLFGFFVCTPIGWILGGQIGPRLETVLSERNAGIIGGVLGGMIPVGGFLLWGWALAVQ